MAKQTKEQEIEELLRKYFETWEQLSYHERLLNEASNSWMEAKSQLFEKRSREHCEAVLNFLQKRLEKSAEAKYKTLAQDVKFWIEADPGRNRLKYV